MLMIRRPSPATVAPPVVMLPRPGKGTRTEPGKILPPTTY
jgi:hypothetical protein